MVTLEQAMALFNGALANAMGIVDQMGGIRIVGLLAVAGFAVGFLACLIKIRFIDG